jgi:arginyl-tRNA synthetase
VLESRGRAVSEPETWPSLASTINHGVIFMGIEEGIRGVVERAIRSLVAAGKLPAEVTSGSFTIERPKRADHGDVATNVALSLSKIARVAPRELAALLQGALGADPGITAAEIAGPGFLNLRLSPSLYHAVLGQIAGAGKGYGRAAAATGERVLLEFVSANPTGPLLISHTRGALVGDVIGRVLEANGHLVSREYYINDFGNQVRIFAKSVAASAFGEPPPADGYPGFYVAAVAGYLTKNAPQVLEAYRANRESDEALGELSRYCVTRMLDGVPGSHDLPGIKATLRSLGVHFDSFYSEESLHRWGRVGSALDRLQASGYIQELPDGALVFKMPEGEGETDQEHEGTAGGGRVLRKNDRKTFTYFSSDIAYHADKLDRGYTRLIDVLGADHHGYVPRIRNVLVALGLPRERFEAVLFQMVSLLKEGKPYKMGKRLGNLITADEVLEEIDEALGKGAGADAMRYFYLSRRSENPIELDVDIAKKAALDNPAIYLQYGHARFCSLLRMAAECGYQVPAAGEAQLGKLTHRLELSLIQRMGAFPRVVEDAGRELTATGIIQFLEGLAQDFNAYWTQTYTEKDPILPSRKVRAEEGWEARWDHDKTRARLFWVEQLRRVYAAGLGLVGIRAPERLERLERPGTEAAEVADDEQDSAGKA